MRESESWTQGATVRKSILVATDGGCRSTPVGPRAGWGYSSNDASLGSGHGAVKGHHQTAQRGEVLGVLHAVAQGQGSLHIVTDSKYVAGQITKLLGGVKLQGKHQDLWDAIGRLQERIQGVTWVKAHLTWEEAKARSIDREHWDLNRRADTEAGKVVDAHVEDPGHWALWGHQLLLVREWQQTLVRIYTQVRELGIVGPSPKGVTERTRGAGPKRPPRTHRTDTKWEGNHCLQGFGSTMGCVSCGRTSCAKRQGRLQQWRRPCQPLKGHLRRLERKHQLRWQGEWLCSRCPLKGKDLRNHGCLFRHPTGGKRFTTKRSVDAGVGMVRKKGGRQSRSCTGAPEAD